MLDLDTNRPESWVVVYDLALALTDRCKRRGRPAQAHRVKTQDHHRQNPLVVLSLLFLC